MFLKNGQQRRFMSFRSWWWKGLSVTFLTSSVFLQRSLSTSAQPQNEHLTYRKSYFMQQRQQRRFMSFRSWWWKGLSVTFLTSSVFLQRSLSTSAQPQNEHLTYRKSYFMPLENLNLNLVVVICIVGGYFYSLPSLGSFSIYFCPNTCLHLSSLVW